MKNMDRSMEVFIDSYLNPFAGIFKYMTVKGAKEVFKENPDVIVACYNKDNRIVVIDKDIMLGILLDNIDENKSIEEFGSTDYCFMDRDLNIYSSGNKYILIRDTMGVIKGALKRIVFEKLIGDYKRP